MITEKSNRLQVIVITDYDYPISGRGSNFCMETRKKFQNTYIVKVFLFCWNAFNFLNVSVQTIYSLKTIELRQIRQIYIPDEGLFERNM